MVVLSSAIPYRSDPAIGTSDVVWVGFVAIGLLALTFFILLQLRRKGWLDTWVRGTVRITGAQRWSIQSQRISRRAVAHTLTGNGQAMLVVETANGIAIAPLVIQAPLAGDVHDDQNDR